jgi:prophage regulatory protein
MAPPEVTGRKPAARRGGSSWHPHPRARPEVERPALKLISFKELKPVKGIPYSRSEIRRKEKAGTFPMHVRLGDGDGAYIAWVEAEIDNYIVEKMQARQVQVSNAPAHGDRDLHDDAIPF